MLNKPPRKAKATPSPAIIKGVALTTVSIKLSRVPNAPTAKAEKALIGEAPDNKMAMLDTNNAVKIANTGIPILVSMAVNLVFFPSFLKPDSAMTHLRSIYKKGWKTCILHPFVD